MTTTNEFDSERIYSKQLKILIKSSNGDERCCTVAVTGELGSPTGTVFKKDFIIRLTNDGDPLFFYHLKLSDEDYKSLQVQQGLLVDFSAFPQKFVDLLELCRQEETKNAPRFVLHLIHSTLSDFAVFNVVETNPFKHLVHLSLKLVPGTDLEVKKYLASCIKDLKLRCERLQSHLSSTELDLHGRLRESNEQLVLKDSELEKLKAELREQALRFHERFDSHSAKEKDRFTQVQNEMKESYERIISDMEYNHSRLVGRLEANASSLETQVRDLTEKCCRLDSTIHELRNRVSSGENETRLSHEELQELRKEKLKLETLRGDLERSSSHLGNRVSILEQELRSKEVQLLQVEGLLQSLREQKTKCTEELEVKQALLTKRENSIKTLSEELNKGNEIIRKLQGEIRNLHTKLKLRTKVTQEQEKVVNEREKQLENLQGQMSSLEEALKSRTEEVKHLNDSLSAAESKLEESQKVLKTNENVINWLNKQLNESQLTQQRSGSVGMAPTVTSFGGSGGGAVVGHFATSTPSGVISQNPLFPTAPVLQYNPVPSMQLVGAKKPAFGSIPEETPVHRNPSPAANKENAAPLHEKYLQASSGGQTASSGLTSTTNSKCRPVNGVRLPRTAIAPVLAKKIPGRQSSAYFPS